MEKNENKEEKSDWSWGGGRKQAWLPGVVLILVGVVFLVRNLYPQYGLDNWWALFILFPALGNLSHAYVNYRETGKLGRSVRSSLFWGLFFILLTASFLFNLNFSLVWPAFLIIGGLAMLLGAL